MMRFNVICGLIKYFSLIGNLSLGLRIPQSGPPKIWLSDYTPMDSYLEITPNPQFLSKPQFQNDFVTKNGTDYVISEETRSIQLTCQADYPVRWSWPVKEEEITYTIHTTDTRKSDFTGISPAPVNTQFQSMLSLSFSNVKFFSTELSCKDVLNAHDNFKSSVYIFVKGKDGIENEGRTIFISLDPAKPNTTQSPIVLPCRPASPDIKLLLEKETVTVMHFRDNKLVSQKTAWWVMTPRSDYLSFDTKIGFTLQRSFYGDRVLGLYKCSVLVNPQESGSTKLQKNGEFLLINVTLKTSSASSMEKLPDTISWEPRSVIRENASVDTVYKADYLRTYSKCCTGVENKPPILLVEACRNPYECQWAENSVLGPLFSKKDTLIKSQNVHYLLEQANIVGDCAQEWMYGAVTSMVVCKGENVDFVEQYVTLFHPLAAGSVQNRSERIQKSENRTVDLQNTTVLTQYMKLSQAKMANIQEKIMIIVSRPIRKPRPGYLPVEFLSRELIWSNTEGAVDQIFGNIEMRGKPVTLLAEYPRDVFFEGEPLNFICLGVRYFYTEYAHIRVNWQNGSKTLLEDPVGQDSSRATKYNLYLAGNADMFSGEGGETVSVFGTPIKAEIGMTSVDCWMPKRDDTKWDKISKELKILPSEAPKFAEPENETVYVYLGDIGRVVTCRMVEGLPIPRLTVYRNGRRVELVVDNNANVSFHQMMSELASGWHNLTGQSTKVNKSVNIHLDMPTVEHTHQVEFKCIATNVNGTTTRTVNIFVIERQGKLLPISLSILGITALILGVLGGKRWHDKRKLNEPARIII